MIEGPPVPHDPSVVEGMRSPEIRPGRLNGKIALITGGGRGIGKSIALSFARESAAKIYFVSRGGTQKGIAEAEETTREISAFGAEVIWIQADMSQKENVERIVETVAEHGDEINVLVNNVGIRNDNAMERDTWESLVETYETNIIGHQYLTGQLIDSDLLPRGTSVIFTSSIVGKSGNFGQEKYAGTKAAITGLVKSMTKSLARLDIRANAILPGFTETEMVGDLASEPMAWAMIEDMTPAGRVAQPEDIAPLFVFLASDESYFVRGTEMIIDGGAGDAPTSIYSILKAGWRKYDDPEERAVAERAVEVFRAEKAARQPITPL